MGPLQIVWFKRNLRTADHQSLLHASRHGAVLLLLLVRVGAVEETLERAHRRIHRFMLKLLLPALPLALASSAVFASEAQQQCYSASDHIIVGNQSIGFYEASASVSGHEGFTYIAFRVSMPDSGQVLEDSRVPVKTDAPGKYTFRFIDGWNNRGKGRLVVYGRRATLTLEAEKIAEGGYNILRSYGTHELQQRACQ